jgi:hypothetical protein
MDGQQSVGFRVTRVWCRRVERQLTLAEHEGCPYCFEAEELASARHERFCDFRPGEDPIHFGFPEDRGRYRR